MTEHENPAPEPPEQGDSGDSSFEHIPEHLETAGRALWTSVLDVYELNPAELAILSTASAQADTVARLESAWAADGYPMTSTGSMGQLTPHPYVAELRQHRSAYRQLLASLKLPADDGPEIDSGRLTPMTRSESARIAAQTRWERRFG